MHTDLGSRILSIFGLIAALGTAAYVYSTNQRLESRADLQDSFTAQLAEQAKKYDEARERIETRYADALARHDQRMEAWNGELNQAIASFQQDATALLTRIDTEEVAASQTRQERFRQVLENLPAMAAATSPRNDSAAELNAPANSASADDPRAADAVAAANDPEGSASSNVSLPKPPSNGQQAMLRIAQTAYRPGTANTTLVLLKNDGREDALIHRIRFRPIADYQADDAPQISADVVSDKVITIPFNPVDNTSRREGFYGICDRTLAEPLRIAAGESVMMRFIIEDRQYAGWGFTGNLAIEYNATDPLVVDSARVAFVAAGSGS